APALQVTSAHDSNAWPEGAGLPTLMVKLVGGDHNVVRSGPGEDYAIVGVYPKDARLEVLAKNEEWYNVRVSPTESGWIHSSLCEEYEDLSALELRPNPRLYSRVGSFSVSGYTGGYAFDRKSNSLVVGGRLGYYLFDFLEIEGGLGWTHVHRPEEIVESLFHLRLEAEDFDMLFYQLGTRIELLPGRRMVPYLVGGVGSSIYLGRSESALDFGGGTMLFVSKTTAVRWELRSYQFHTGTDQARRMSHNVEFSIGSTLLF
ncbi:MAG: SH3 domain-containing protein, partial [Candidatus Eisenbacteria bacterium]|nr:SH3 domain-containing protein [Candidatus Eisenbacteria bacterium]